MTTKTKRNSPERFQWKQKIQEIERIDTFFSEREDIKPYGLATRIYMDDKKIESTTTTTNQREKDKLNKIFEKLFETNRTIENTGK